MDTRPTRVTIVGGGVAALEALIAIRELAQERVELELVTPTANWVNRPLAVAEPFGLGEVKSYDIVRIARDHGAALHLASVQAVEPHDRRLVTLDGRRLAYELLLVAIGARPSVSLPGSVTLNGPGYTNRFRKLLRDLDDGRIHNVAFAVPSGTSWPLPLYELALMTAAFAADRGLRDVQLSVVTPEQRPLELFAPPASTIVLDLLGERGIRFHGGRHPAEVRPGELAVVPGSSIEADRVVSLPHLRGPSLSGLPQDAGGFIPVGPHGLVPGEDDVYAAGDATSYPIKQGGVAAQQADTAAEAIAARVGAPVDPRPFRPVVRGLLLTGGPPQYIRADVAGGGDHPHEASSQPLWWPPSKVAARRLAPYLALHHDEIEKAPSGLAVEAAVPLLR
jgi:sulfide:quinone oxidoreductase